MPKSPISGFEGVHFICQLACKPKQKERVMATINKRGAQEGKTKFQARIRLKGHPTETSTFERLDDLV